MAQACVGDIRDSRPNQEPLRRIMLATDLGEVSSSAERAAIELAHRSGAALVVLSVIDPSRLRLPGGLFLARIDQVRTTREAAASALIGKARAVGVPAHFLIWEGEPGESIVEVADAEGVDAVVLGSHGRGRLGRLLLGSVSSRVIDAARWPVFIARGDQIVRHDPVPGRAAVARPATR